MDEVTFYYRQENKNWKPIGDEYRMILDCRSLFMGSKYFIFYYLNKQIGGNNDVDFFDRCREK